MVGVLLLQQNKNAKTIANAMANPTLSAFSDDFFSS
jgi:hypothetical protein